MSVRLVSMEATRNRGRGKMFACFRPVVLADDDVHDEPIFESASLQSSGDEGDARRKRKLGRSFSAALKTAILRTALLKKYSRSENHVHDYKNGFRGQVLSRGRSFVKNLKKNMTRKSAFLEPEDVFWSKNPNRSPIFSSSSSSRTPSIASSSTSNSSRSSPTRSEPDIAIQRSISLDHFRQMTPMNNKLKPMKKESSKKSCGYFIPTLEVCVLLVCLFALIWGKVFAIVACTSAWLFIAPDRRSQKLQRGGHCEVFDTEEYKKRVIMEGLLERDRCRFPQY